MRSPGGVVSWEVSSPSAQTEGEAPPQAPAELGDAVARYCRASSANDIDALMATLAPGAELVSPLSGRMVFRGVNDIRILAEAIYGTLEDMHWGAPIGHGRLWMAIAESRIAGLRLDDAMVFELDEDGLIARVRPHLRPWLATTVFALALGPKMAPHAGVILRALRAR